MCQLQQAVVSLIYFDNFWQTASSHFQKWYGYPAFLVPSISVLHTLFAFK